MTLPGIPKPGEVLAGKYRVERLLGAGGMGVVLEAWHLILEQKVAVKMLLPSVADLPEVAPRFLREARAAAALQSEHVARVLDMGNTDNGAPYIVLEFLQGRDFGEFLKISGPMDIQRAVDYLLQASEAIAEAHIRRIVHRDLKPKNLFLTARADGRPLVKVLDFGLSKMTDNQLRSLTDTSTVMGSVHYMSPEQIRSLKATDARTDIWALGIILYQLLAGCRPFVGDGSVMVAAAILAENPKPISTERADVPAALEALILRCLEKDITKRVQTMADFAQGLLPFASPTGVLSVETIMRLFGKAPIVPQSVGVETAQAPVAQNQGSDVTSAKETSPVDAVTLPLNSRSQTKRSITAYQFPVAAVMAISLVLFGAGIGLGLGFADGFGSKIPEQQSHLDAQQISCRPVTDLAPNPALSTEEQLSPRAAESSSLLPTVNVGVMSPVAAPTAVSAAKTTTPKVVRPPLTTSNPSTPKPRDPGAKWD